MNNNIFHVMMHGGDKKGTVYMQMVNTMSASILQISNILYENNIYIGIHDGRRLSIYIPIFPTICIFST